jgi:hypothetical protein
VNTGAKHGSATPSREDSSAQQQQKQKQTNGSGAAASSAAACVDFLDEFAALASRLQARIANSEDGCGSFTLRSYFKQFEELSRCKTKSGVWVQEKIHLADPASAQAVACDWVLEIDDSRACTAVAWAALKGNCEVCVVYDGLWDFRSIPSLKEKAPASD